MRTLETPPIAIGNRFGKLKIVAMVPEKGTYLCQCNCGLEIEVHHNRLKTGRAIDCKGCRAQARFIAARQIDRRLLLIFPAEVAQKIVVRYIEHLRACANTGITSETFARFVGEIGKDFELAEIDPIESRKEFLSRVEHRKFDQYQGPKMRRNDIIDAAA